MIDAHRENRPLLSEDISDEELGERSLSYRGRARSHARGAAAIITHWPDHWSSFKHYWTILGLFALIIMIIYNAVILFAIFPSSYTKVKERSINQYNERTHYNKLPEVFMHIFVNDNREQLDNYLPYINSLTHEFTNYKYTIFMIFNDTTDESTQSSAELHNELALNSIMSKEEFATRVEDKNQNIYVKKMSLVNYMDNSVLSKYWRKIPHHFIPFLVRAISVWEHGGIAFNPAIVTAASPNLTYIRILRIILKKYLDTKQFNQPKHGQIPKVLPKKLLPNPKKEVHNIRDIIDAIENEIESSEHLQLNLAEAETNNAENVVHRRKLMTVPNVFYQNSNNKTFNDTFNYSNLGINIKNNTLSELETMKTKIKHFLHLNKSAQNKTIENKTKSLEVIFPSFFDFFKLDMSPISVLNSNIPASKSNLSFDEKKYVSTKAEEQLLSELNKTWLSNNLVAIDSDDIEAKSYNREYPEIKNTKGKQNRLNKSENAEHLFVDTSGNILATRTACHSFIGNIFTNIIYAQKQNLTEYLTSQLSFFCRGSLNPCLVPGFHVILL